VVKIQAKGKGEIEMWFVVEYMRKTSEAFKKYFRREFFDIL